MILNEKLIAKLFRIRKTLSVPLSIQDINGIFLRIRTCLHGIFKTHHSLNYTFHISGCFC